MRRNHFVNGIAVVGLVSVFLAGSLAMARDNNDQRNNQSGRSSSSSNSGNSGSSGRSFSSGGSSMQSRSSSGGDSGRSFSARSGQSFQLPSSGSGSSIRSFGSGSGGPTFSGKSFSGRSLDSDTSSIRSFGSRTVARPVDDSPPNAGGGSSSSNSQGFSRGNPLGGNPNYPGLQNFSNGSNNSARASRFNNSSNDNLQGSSKSNQNRDSNNASGSNSGKGSFNGQNNQFGNSQPVNNALGNGRAGNRFGQQQQTQTNGQNAGSQTNKEKIDAFLKLRQGGGTTLDNTNGRNSTSRLNRDGNVAGDIRNRFDNGQLGSQKSLADAKKDADQAWLKRFGKSDRTSGDQPKVGKDGKPFQGKDDLRNGIVNLKGERGRIDPKKIDKAFVDRNYQDWRKGAFDAKKGGGSDNRDWTGTWKNGDRFAAADEVRQYWKKGGGKWKDGKKNDKDLPFSKDWWKGHDHHDGHWNHWDHFGDHHYHPYYWWNWCSAPGLTTWITFGWGAPCYWDYGPGEYIYCNNGIVYVNGVWFEPAPVFYRRTLLLAQQAPVFTPVEAAQVEWLPLGVFAISRDGVADNNVLVQLAVTRDGVIGGTIFNQLTGATFPIQGMVDKATQRAAWTYTDDLGAQIVMESSIYNLTQPAATGLIHYSPDNIQVIELVRLEDPSAGQ